MNNKQVSQEFYPLYDLLGDRFPNKQLQLDNELRKLPNIGKVGLQEFANATPRLAFNMLLLCYPDKKTELTDNFSNMSPEQFVNKYYNDELAGR